MGEEGGEINNTTDQHFLKTFIFFPVRNNIMITYKTNIQYVFERVIQPIDCIRVSKELITIDPYAAPLYSEFH